MRNSLRGLHSVIACAALISLPSSIRAQVSLASEDKIDEVPITIDAATCGAARAIDHRCRVTYTVIRDARRPTQWYYVPSQPRLTERATDGAYTPEFSLTKIQSRDPANPGNIINGGFLQFAVALAVPGDEVMQLKQAIVERNQFAQDKGLSPADITLASLPIKSATVSVYGPTSVDGKAKLLVGNVEGVGIAPTFATQKMAFSVELSALGADVYEALANSTTGIPVQVTLTYGGLTPKAGFKVNVDYEQVYKHYSRAEEIRAEASYFGLFGASYRRSSSQFVNDLTNSGALTVELNPGEAFGEEQIAKYLQPVLKRINDQMLDFLRPPAEIEPARAAAPGGGGFFGGAG
jgi:hypothetical protein